MFDTCVLLYLDEGPGLTSSKGMKMPPAKTVRMTRAACEITIAMLGLSLPCREKEKSKARSCPRHFRTTQDFDTRRRHTRQASCLVALSAPNCTAEKTESLCPKRKQTR